MWPFHAQDLASLVLRVQGIGEEAAGNVAHVQFQQRVGVRRRGQRKAAAMAVLQQEVDVLAGEELQPLVGGQLQRDDGHIGGRLVDRFDPTGQALDRNVAGTAHLAHFDRQVGLGSRAAEQRVPHAFFVVGERRGLVDAVVDVAG